MATRKTKRIDPVTVAAYALKKVKSQEDYNQIESTNLTDVFNMAWESLSQEEQQRIINICGQTPQPDINAIALELTNCTALLQMQALKIQYGEETIRAAWKLLPVEERRRLKAICDGQQQPTMKSDPLACSICGRDKRHCGHKPDENWTGAYTQDLTEQWSEEQAKLNSTEPTKQSKRSLFSISDDLEKLNELLDECGDDAEQQELINNWLEQLGSERDTKLDSYAALISEMLARAEVRKAEAKRMMELAAVDENRARLLKDRLKYFFQTHNLKTVDTARYKLSLAKNGGKQPLILKDGLSPAELPEQFQKVSIDPDTTAIRQALEAGEHLDFASLGDRGSSIRIK